MFPFDNVIMGIFIMDSTPTDGRQFFGLFSFKMDFLNIKAVGL